MFPDGLDFAWEFFGPQCFYANTVEFATPNYTCIMDMDFWKSIHVEDVDYKPQVRRLVNILG